MLDLDDGDPAPAAPGMALARKWRPRRFADIAGQEHAVRALRGALASGRLHHAFMFTGTRGIGKTTLARILAKGFNCERLEDGEPCGECDHCAQTDSGSHPDVIELDAASTTQVDAMRSLLETANYAPAKARRKVYIIDEVHMLSRHSFNAMLKTLEEPPEHVKFILATTDPQQVPATVQSRCLRFSLRRLPVELIAGQLGHVLREEGLEFEEGAARVIAEHADGSMRDALSILDEAIGAGELTEEWVRAMVGAAGPDQAPALLGLLLDGDGGALLERSAAMHEQALALDRVSAELAALLHQAQLAALAPEAGEQMHGAVRRAAKEWDEIGIQVAYEVAVQGSRSIAAAADARAAFEMTLLRILALSRAQGARGEAAPAGGEVEPEPAAAPKPEPAPPRPDQPAKAKPAAPPQAAAAPAPDGRLPANADEWRSAASGLGGPAAALASECLFVSSEGGTLRLRIDKSNEALLKQEDSLRSALRRSSGIEDAGLEISIGDGEADALTPGEQERRERDEERERRRRQLEKAAVEQGVKERFPDARVTSVD